MQNNAKNIVSKLFANEKISDDDLQGMFDIMLYSTHRHTLHRLKEFDSRGMLFNCWSDFTGAEDAFIKINEFKVITNSTEFNNIASRDIIINSDGGIDYQQSSGSKHKYSDNRVHFVFAHIKEERTLKGNAVSKSELAFFNNANWLYYGLKHEKVLTSSNEPSVVESGGDFEFVFSTRPFQRDSVDVSPYFFFEEVKDRILENVERNIYFIRIIDDEFSAHDFTNLLALTKQEEAKSKLFIIDFSYDIRKMFKLKILFAFLNNDINSNILFLFNGKVLINSFNSNVGVVCPIVRFSEKTYYYLFGQKPLSEQYYDFGFNHLLATDVNDIKTGIENYRKLGGGKTLWLKEHIWNKCRKSYDAKSTDLAIIDWMITANLADVLRAKNVKTIVLQRIKDRLREARIIDIYMLHDLESYI